MLDEIRTAAFLCEAIYDYPETSAWTWDYVSSGDVYWAVKKIIDTSYVCFRGSTTLADWLRDLNAFANPISTDKLGPVHPGFFNGVPEAWEEIKTKITTNNFILTGHSLGSGEVDICAALAVLDGLPPRAKIGFGAPKAGFKQLGQLVKDVPDYCFRNTDGVNWDLITSVPFSFFPEEYKHTAPLLNVHCEPVEGDTWGPFAWHRMQYYRQAVASLTDESLSYHEKTSSLRRRAYFGPAKEFN